MSLLQLSSQRRRKHRRTGVTTTTGRRRGPRAISWPVAGIGLLWWLVALLLFGAGGTLQHTNLVAGERARTTVVSVVPFDAPDLHRTEILRRHAVDAVLPIFSVEESDLDTMVRAITKLFTRLKEVRAEEELAVVEPGDEAWEAAAAERAGSVLEALHFLGLPIGIDEALRLAPPQHVEAVQTAILKALRQAWHRGIVSESQRDSRFEGVASEGKIVLQSSDNGGRTTIELNAIPLPPEALDRVVQDVLDALPELALPPEALAALCRERLRPNLRYQRRLTEELRAEAQRNVPTQIMQVPVGATLVAAGERITPQMLGQILAHEQRVAELRSGTLRLLEGVGNAALLAMALFVCGGLLRLVAPGTLRDLRAAALLAALALLPFALAKALLYFANTSLFISPSFVEPLVPLALAPILGAILLGGPAPIVSGLLSTLSVSILYGQSFSMLILGLVITMAAALAGRSVRRRASTFRVGLVVGLAAALVFLAIGALRQIGWSSLWPHALIAIVNGLLCALVTLALLPLLEWSFGLTADITLLEYSDMSHPLLQRMAIEAPGTYHHSLMVANLAHSAATELDLHALLLRVCAYFHDIGKLVKPDFFIENIAFSENPHDDLSPSMSALVIVSHVKEGVALAQRHKLPRPIVDAIMQHHGTSLIAYFYHRAQKQAENDEHRSSSGTVNPQDYRYPGPKPQTPEMGILLLADSVEAASRSMQKPTPSRIESLVNEIVDDRIRDGQLDACALTLAQIDAIKRSFIFSLSNMLHGRIAYPKDEDRNQNPPDKRAARPPEEPKDLLPVDHAAHPAAAT